MTILVNNFSWAGAAVYREDKLQEITLGQWVYLVFNFYSCCQFPLKRLWSFTNNVCEHLNHISDNTTYIVFASFGWKIFHYSFNLHFFYCQWCWACFNDLKGSLHYFSVNCIIPLFLVLLGYSFLVYLYILIKAVFLFCVWCTFSQFVALFKKFYFSVLNFYQYLHAFLFFVLCLERLFLLSFFFYPLVCCSGAYGFKK